MATDFPAAPKHCAAPLTGPLARAVNPFDGDQHARAYLPVECAAGRTSGVKADVSSGSGRLVGALDVDTEVFGLVLGQLGQVAAQRLNVDQGHLLVEVLGQPVHSLSYSSFLVHSSIWAMVWLAKLVLITNDGCPVALPG